MKSNINDIAKSLSLSEEQFDTLKQNIDTLSHNHIPWYMRLFSFVGAFFAASLFLGFMGIANLFNSSITMGAIGILFLCFGSILSRKVIDNPIIEPFILAILIDGQIMILLALLDSLAMRDTENIAFVGLILQAILFIVCFSSIQRFLSVLLFSISLQFIIYKLSIFYIAPLLTIAIVFIFAYLHYRSPYFLYLERKNGSIYAPLTFGLLFSTLGLTAFSAINFDKEILLHNWWIATLGITATVLWLIIKISYENRWATNFTIALSLGIITVALPTFNSPGIILSFLIILVAFRFESRLTMVFGIVGLLFYISAFYYLLQYTLLTKSIVLMVSGLFYSGAFGIVYKYWPSEEGE